jgi:hypothetical protein
MVDKVLEVTGASKLAWVGHSQVRPKYASTAGLLRDATGMHTHALQQEFVAKPTCMHGRRWLQKQHISPLVNT